MHHVRHRCDAQVVAHRRLAGTETYQRPSRRDWIRGAEVCGTKEIPVPQVPQESSNPQALRTRTVTIDQRAHSRPRLQQSSSQFPCRRCEVHLHLRRTIGRHARRFILCCIIRPLRRLRRLFLLLLLPLLPPLSRLRHHRTPKHTSWAHGQRRPCHIHTQQRRLPDRLHTATGATRPDTSMDPRQGTSTEALHRCSMALHHTCRTCRLFDPLRCRGRHQ